MCHPLAWAHRASLTALFWAALVSLSLLATGLQTEADDGHLQQLREDVRTGSPSSGSGESGSRDDTNRNPSSHDEDSEQNSWDASFVGLVITSPFWGPVGLLHDDYSVPAHFPRFPYDDVPGYLATDSYSLVSRRWAARLSGEYREPFDHIQVVSGRLLVSTTSRFGLDTQWDYLQEHRADRSHDHLWSGDCNLVFRFAQGEYAEFRTGLGFNWLDDRQQTDFGFNFTYGFDVFPCRPWVVSAEIDAGTLGKAGLFRARTTVGVMVHGVEAYTGYEYFDVGRTHLNCLVGGLRIWF